MTKSPLISRRLLLAGIWLAGSAAWAQVKRGTDQGIGGTGITRGDDHGIGGTGIVGIIQRFGSIYVNGERISYAPDVPVRIDGEASSARGLRIGQLARVVAVRQADGALTTRSIAIASEVTGPIEAVRDSEITVLGQKVLSSGRETWRRPGTRVTVFGLRRTDGAIVATLVEPRHDSTARVAGPVERGPDGLRIGGLRLTGVDPLLVGQRIQVEGSASQGALQVARTRVDDFSDLAGASRLSVEAYVQRSGAGLQLGSGLVARDGSRFGPASGEARVVLNGVFDRSRGLQVESVQAVSQPPSPQAPGGAGNAPRSPGGSILHPGSGAPGSTGGQPGGAPSAPGTAHGPGPGSAGGPSGPGGPGPIGPGGPGSPGGPPGPGGLGGGGMGGPGSGMGGGMGGRH